MAIQKNEGKFRSASGVNDIFYTHWQDDVGSPRGILLIAHGMAEHIDRYDAFARFMAAHGYAVYGSDHLGHGRSAADDSNLGYFAEKDGRYHVVEDVRALQKLARGEWPSAPVVLLGHSMGSFVARLLCTRYSDEIDAAIFMGTADANPAAGVGIALVNLISLLRGERYKSKLVDTIAFGANNKEIPNPATKFDWLSTDPAEVQKYIDDPWCGYLFTLSGFRELFKILREVSGKDWAASIRRDLPILVVSGMEDPVGGYGKGVQAVFEQLHAGIEDVALLLYDDMRHEVLNEVGREAVYADLLEWCDGAIAR